MSNQSYIPTKPKIFYDLMFLFEKINSANKNINRYERLTIIEPYILDNIASAMKKVSKTAKEIKAKISASATLSEAVEDLETAREFFMFFSQTKKLNYNQNFILETNLNFENIAKQLHGWQRQQSRR